MKTFIEKLIANKKQALIEVQQRGDASQDVVEVRGLVKQADEIRGEIAELEAQLGKVEERKGQGEELEARGKVEAKGNFINVGSFAYGTGVESRDKEMNEKFEERGRYLMEGRTVQFTAEEVRAVTVASSSLVTGTHVDATLNQGFDKVSSIVDAVNAVPLIGASVHEKGFIKEVQEGGYRADETAAYSQTNNTFGNVSISAQNITAYDEISKSARVLSPVDYQSAVAEGVRRALRKKIAADIIKGTGTGQLTGIYNADITTHPLVKVLEVKDNELVDANLLNKVVFNYGGDLEVELGYPVLFLNKDDLAAFANVRSTTGEPLYKITLNGNTGTISSDGSYNVKFIINNAVNSLKNSANGTNTIIYGNPKFYELPIFSAIDVRVSEDYKFNTGMLAVRADVYAGGSPAAHKGFTVVKKVAAV